MFLSRILKFIRKLIFLSHILLRPTGNFRIWEEKGKKEEEMKYDSNMNATKKFCLAGIMLGVCSAFLIAR